MKPIYYVQCLLLVTTLLTNTRAKSQNIINDTVVLSTNAQVSFLFPSLIDKTTMSNPNGSYEAIVTKKNLLLKAQRKEANPQVLTVNEGSNTHTFVMVYNENVPALKRDWSNKKKLASYVKDKKARADARLAEADALLEKGQYDAALALYSRLQYDVEEAERQPIETKIAQCEQMSFAGKQKKYSDAMTRAASLEKAKKYREADSTYDVALGAKNDDPEALRKRAANRTVWFQDSKGKALDAFDDNNFILAKSGFAEAREIDSKTFQQCCKDKYETTLRKAPDQVFRLQRTKGNEAFDIHDWTVAKQAYDSALAVNKNDDYCSKRLIKIKEAVEKERDDEKKEAQYYALLSSAKGFAAAKEIDAAVAKYDAAMKLFPDRRFAKEKREALTKLKTNASAKR
ncbi:hypothetical protein [Flavisolibacter ginsenosidimutans]|uniref:Tetratricopeptide repeat protein n=1 Tax=Flavisolibacter ginsenosidimutans TaxID=661481 RepID=A0A5B8ULB9_9BACT|nr:hypothetical protein [Flavisolibacter ginsenosidimutans]QEC56805.1 hypothetical protein FSB75_13155 [Flavisolibacter ginsenosidimutans]